MVGTRPSFADSPYFVAEPGNWHLKPGAPAEVVEEFTQFMAEVAEVSAPQASVDDILRELKG
jgi:hypothetical protein